MSWIRGSVRLFGHSLPWVGRMSTQKTSNSERTGVVVEPRLSTQWFVKMDQLAKNAIANQD
ncbi:class I tRNA ligase family protein, partial [Mycobacterium tuberculosis]|nr:class I tRNA ligase family protein [Mycobacterium tuberculosis]